MHIQGDKLYGTNMTGQVLWLVLMFPKGLKPFDARPSLTFRGFDAKFGCSVSNALQASPFAECLNTPSFVRPSACHLMWEAVCCDIYNLCNLKANGNHCNTFTGRLFDVWDDQSSLVISSFHFDAPHTVHVSNFSFFFRITYNDFDKPESFHIQAPSLLNIFFVSYILLGKAGSSIGTISLMNSSKDVKIVLLIPPIHFKLYR
jgi:hypothetical protein